MRSRAAITERCARVKLLVSLTDVAGSSAAEADLDSSALEEDLESAAFEDDLDSPAASSSAGAGFSKTLHTPHDLAHAVFMKASFLLHSPIVDQYSQSLSGEELTHGTSPSPSSPPTSSHAAQALRQLTYMYDGLTSHCPDLAHWSHSGASSLHISRMPNILSSLWMFCVVRRRVRSMRCSSMSRSASSACSPCASQWRPICA